MKLHPTQRVCQSLAIESLSKEMERRRGGPSFKHILDRHLFLRLANSAGQRIRQKSKRFHSSHSTLNPSLYYMKIFCTTGQNGNCPFASPSLSLFFYDESVVVGSSGHPWPMPPPPPFVAVHMNFYCGLCLLPRSCPCWAETKYVQCMRNASAAYFGPHLPTNQLCKFLKYC